VNRWIGIGWIILVLLIIGLWTGIRSASNPQRQPAGTAAALPDRAHIRTPAAAVPATMMWRALGAVTASLPEKQDAVYAGWSWLASHSRTPKRR
jgi:hypothetical protein